MKNRHFIIVFLSTLYVTVILSPDALLTTPDHVETQVFKGISNKQV